MIVANLYTNIYKGKRVHEVLNGTELYDYLIEVIVITCNKIWRCRLLKTNILNVPIFFCHVTTHLALT